MSKFEDLTFEESGRGSDGIWSRVFYPNGYGASVIRSRYSYGGELGLYELAVLRCDGPRPVICYDTPITDGVIGHLAPDDISALLVRIAALPAVVAA